MNWPERFVQKKDTLELIFMAFSMEAKFEPNREQSKKDFLFAKDISPSFVNISLGVKEFSLWFSAGQNSNEQTDLCQFHVWERNFVSVWAIIFMKSMSSSCGRAEKNKATSENVTLYPWVVKSVLVITYVAVIIMHLGSNCSLNFACAKSDSQLIRSMSIRHAEKSQHTLIIAFHSLMNCYF